MTHRVSLAALLILLVHGAIGAAAEADIAAPASYAQQPSQGGRIGIGLIPRPDGGGDDPRARMYVVDHVTPGTHLSRQVEITNTSDVTHRVALYAAAAQIENATFAMASGRSQNELTTWTTVDKPSLDVAPHSRTRVVIRFDVPPAASTGERYAVIWAEVASQGKGATRNLRLVNRVGIRVYLHVGPGSAPPSAFQIESLRPGRTATGVDQLRAQVHNTGDRALDLSGFVTMSKRSGGETTPPLRAGDGTTLAPHARTWITVVADRPLASGAWQVRLALQSGRVTNSATAVVTFPHARGRWGDAVPVRASHITTLAVGGVLVVAAAVVAGSFGVRRTRWRPRVKGIP